MEQTRRLQQEQKSAAELEFRPAFDPLKHTPEVHVKKILISKKIRPIESLAAAKARVENDARFFKDKLLDLAIQSRTWMRDAATVDKAIDKAFLPLHLIILHLCAIFPSGAIQ